MGKKQKQSSLKETDKEIENKQPLVKQKKKKTKDLVVHDADKSKTENILNGKSDKKKNKFKNVCDVQNKDNDISCDKQTITESFSENNTSTDSVNKPKKKKKKTEKSVSENSDLPNDSVKVKAKKRKQNTQSDSASSPNKKVKLESENQEKSDKKKKKKKDKKKKKQEKKDTKEEVKDVGKNGALEFLKLWKNDRSSWKFQKVRQTWLLQNMYNSNLVSNDNFSVLLEYLEDMRGGARTMTIEKAEKMVDSYGSDESDEEGSSSEEEDKKESSKIQVTESQYERARQIVQLLV